jgi:hypothetical protein
MLSRKSVLVLFVVSILFITACESGTQDTTGPASGAYIDCYGDEAQMITAEFDPFAPVSSLDSPYGSGEEIDVEVILKNKLPYDIDEGKVKVRLTGESAINTIFAGAHETTAGQLFGSDVDTCLEEEVTVDVGPITYAGTTTTKISKEITGLYCYDEPIVVKAFLYFTKDVNEIGTNLPRGSNPPSSIQVTDIQQNPVNIGTAGGEMRFKIFLQNIGTGRIVENLNQCFEAGEVGDREELKINVQGAYNIECPDTVKLSRDEKTDVISCIVSDIDTTNLGPSAIETTIILSGFAYEDEIPPTTIWLEP